MTENVQLPGIPSLIPAYATVNNFCLLSGIGRTKLYEAMKIGHIPARKVGNRTLISVAAGLAWIESQPAYRPTSRVANAEQHH